MLTLMDRRIRSLSYLLIAIVALSTFTFAQSSADRKKARTITEQADRAYREKRFKDAISGYSEAATLIPTNPYAHFWKANAHYELKEYAEAETEFTLALTQGHKPVEVYKVRWYMFYDQKKYDTAIQDLNKALQAEPRNTLLINGLGENYRLKKMYPEAIAAYERAAAASPKEGDADFYIARIHSERGDFTAQVAAAERSVKKPSRVTGEAYYLLGDGYERQKRFAEAIPAYERAIAAKPEKYEPYRNLASIQQRQGKLKEAIATMERARAAINGEGRIFTELAWLYSLADRHGDAVGSANGAIKLLPNGYLGYTNLCRALNDTKQYQRAIEACNKALSLNRGDGETLYYLGRASDFLKRTAEATRYYRQAVVGLSDFVAKNPDYPEGHYLLGNAYFSDGQRERAVLAFQRAVELSPMFTKARANLGRLYVAMGNKNAALEQHRILAGQDAPLAAQLKAAIDQM